MEGSRVSGGPIGQHAQAAGGQALGRDEGANQAIGDAEMGGPGIPREGEFTWTDHGGRPSLTSKVSMSMGGG